MASAEIESGICGFCTTVKTTAEGRTLTEVDPYREISYRGEGPVTLKLAAEHLVHPACPVPSGILKAIEVAAGLALPKDASIKPSKD
jgi:hypothetical protein